MTLGGGRIQAKMSLSFPFWSVAQNKSRESLSFIPTFSVSDLIFRKELIVIE